MIKGLGLISFIDTDETLSNNSDLYPASQKAVKTYVDTYSASIFELQGDWNATTNTPTLDGTITTGYAYRVSVAGNTNLGGITDREVEDLAVKTSTSWIKIDNSANNNHSLLDNLDSDDHTQYQRTCSNQFAITDYTFDGTETRNSGYAVITTTGNKTINLDADLFSTGFEITICKFTNDTNYVTIDAQSGNNIDGSQTILLTEYNETLILIKDGANTWKVKSHYGGSFTGTKKYVRQDNPIFTSNIILSKISGNGIKVDNSTPTFGRRDLLGKIFIRDTTNPVNPTFNVYRGSLRQYEFSVNDECYIEFHIPHDRVYGTNLFLHFHWSHIATNVSGGSVEWRAEISYSKGHNQAPFQAPITFSVQQNASTTQYQHLIAEGELTNSTPSVNQIDTDDIQVDGLLLVRVYLYANNITVSSGGVPNPFLHFVDIHYQTTNIGTKAKAPDFYS